MTISISKDASSEEKKKLGFQRDAIALCSAETVEEKLKLLTKISKLNWLPELFKSDIQAWKNSLSDSQKKVKTPYDGWTVKFTDDPFDLFLCGTEIEGCCQNVNAGIQTSKCLLAYVTDGKNKLIEVKGADGKITARAVMRLLLDDNNKPVLFLERIYPALAPLELSNAITQMAKDLSDMMGLPLLSKESNQGQLYPSQLISLGGRAPFEYVDANSEVEPSSQFAIRGARQLL